MDGQIDGSYYEAIKMYFQVMFDDIENAQI